MFKSSGLIAAMFCGFAICAINEVHAATYNLQLGQSIDMQQGDTALVRQGGIVTAVSCNGGAGPSLPPRQQFEMVRDAHLSDLLQDPKQEALRTLQCQSYSAEQTVRQAINDALNYAREACFNAGYQNCAQPIRTDEQYSFSIQGWPGRYVCRVVARIVGTNPR